MKKQNLGQQAEKLLACAQRNKLARVLLLLVVAGLPWVARDFFQLPALAFDNFTDAVFYPSYASNFTELVLRHGFIYYAMRFGVIFPDALASWFFGVPAGWLILRATIQSLLLVTVFLFFEKRGGWVAGAIAVLLWWSNPIPLRILTTTYLDSLAMPFFVVGAILLSWPEARVWMALLAGVLLGLAASSHLYLLILMPLMGPFILGSRWMEKKAMVLSVVWALVGAMVTWSVAYAYYRGIWGVVDMWAPTKEFMGRMADGGTEMWRSPLTQILSDIPAWLAPVMVLAGIGFLLRRDALALWGAWLSLAATSSFFWLGDLVGGAYALSMPMYFTYLFPALFLAAATGFSEILQRTLTAVNEANRAPLLANLLLFLLVGGFLVGSSSALTRIMSVPIAWIAIAMGGLVVVMGFFLLKQKNHTPWTNFSFLIAVCASHILCLATPFYSQYLGHYKRINKDELWQPALAAQLSRILPLAFLDGRPLRFWYDDTQPGVIQMVQSSYLHSFSRFYDNPHGASGFPQAGEGVAGLLGREGVEILVVMDEQEARSEVASTSLLSKLNGWAQIKKGRLQSKGKKIYYSILQRNAGEDRHINSTGPFQWEANAPAELIYMTDGAKLLRSGSRKWMFDAMAILPEESGPSVVFESRVVSGRFSLSILNSQDETLASTELWPTRQPVKRTLYFPGENKNLRLVLRNMMPDKSVSKILLYPASEK